MRKDARNPRKAARKANRKQRVKWQAILLIHERIRQFGRSWREGCAIQIPKGFDEAKAIKDILGETA